MRSDPILVEVHSGLWVIEDYREPVFYADGYYWLYQDGAWHRSSVYTGGWVRYRAPQVVLRIDRPQRYVHYRGAAGHRVRRGPRGAVSVRDRGDMGNDWQDRREEKREDKEEKREDKAEAREERREEKEERREEKAEAREEKREEKAEAREEKREEKADRKHDKDEHKHDKGGRKKK